MEGRGSVYAGGLPPEGASAYRVVCIHGGLPTGGGSGQTPLESEKRGGSAYRRLCIQGVSAYRGGLSRPTTPPAESEKQAVRILLECFLVKTFLEDISPLCEATDTPVLDYW